MNRPEIRSSQLITTFGPGAMVDLPDDSVIIAGIDRWRYNNRQPIPIIPEPRLQRKIEMLLGIQGIVLRQPPPAVEDRGFTPDICAYRFPEWFIVQNSIITAQRHRARRLIHQSDLERGQFRDDDNRRYPVVPVRFVRACRRGHVGDIDWHAFIHGTDQGCRRELFIEERGTSGDLESIVLRCGCGVERPMSQATGANFGALGTCDGGRPWLGAHTREICGEPNRLLIRSASNAYFPQLLSVISIPDAANAIDEAIDAIWDSHLSAVENEEQLSFVMRMQAVSQKIEDFPEERIMEAIHRKRNGRTIEERPVKEVEFEALTEVQEELGVDEPGGNFFARSLPRDSWESPLMESVERVVLVHRLREVIAQLGFTRFEATMPDIQGELDMDVQRAPLGLEASWLPAIENRGEGIFIQFKAAVVNNWLQRDAVKDRDTILQAGFDHWLHEHEGSSFRYPGLPYYLLHSLAHLLITEIALECGYPASSLRERIYAMRNQYGILIYTGSPDAEGTLGGLIEEGRQIKHHLRKALEMGLLCSNDPVCAFHRPDQHHHQPLHGSACHGCLLISETSCEQYNNFLDRALIIPTVEGIGAELFRGVL